MKIDRHQMSAFKQAAVGEFVIRASEHLRRFFPEQSKNFNEEELHAVILRGVSRAAEYGIHGANDVTLYLNLLMAFGSDFDRVNDWAKEILMDQRLPEPAWRVRRLYRRALEQRAERGEADVEPY